MIQTITTGKIKYKLVKFHEGAYPYLHTHKTTYVCESEPRDNVIVQRER